MKKIVGIVLVLALLMTVALAESVPSKSTADMTTVTVVVPETVPSDAGLVIMPVVEDTETVYVEKVEQCRVEVEKLAASATVEEYFGEVKNPLGEIVSLKEVLETETLSVHEFMPIVVDNYEAEYGSVTVVFQFATPYEIEQTVIVLIGVPDEITGELVWTALEGVVTEEGIQIEFDEGTLELAQNSDAIMAVVSK